MRHGLFGPTPTGGLSPFLRQTCLFLFFCESQQILHQHVPIFDFLRGAIFSFRFSIPKLPRPVCPARPVPAHDRAVLTAPAIGYRLSAIGYSNLFPPDCRIGHDYWSLVTFPSLPGRRTQSNPVAPSQRPPPRPLPPTPEPSEFRVHTIRVGRALSPNRVNAELWQFRVSKPSSLPRLLD